KIIAYELRNGIDGLTTLLNELRQKETGNQRKILVVFDFSRRCDLEPVLALLREIKNIRDSPVSISGILAFDLHFLSDEYVQVISAIIPSFIFISNTTNVIAFPAVSRKSSVAGIISQDIVDTVVKHSLEQLILMNLKQPVSGFDILKDISDRFHVDIPLARVYSYLYNLESIGLVTMETRGRSKVYVPTEKGRIFIDMRLHDFQVAHEFILGYKR
ncbi:MAG: PadR family transcriptional regulator, partial [Methanoregula sp.]